MLKKNPKYSKRINYDALKDLFVDGVDIGAFANMDDKTDKDEDLPLEGGDQTLEGLYPMDDKSEGGGDAPMVIIEENNAPVPPNQPGNDDDKDADVDVDADADAEMDAEGDLDTGWGDDYGYEQEV
jgi:transcription factor IIIB 90 kDa subunit